MAITASAGSNQSVGTASVLTLVGSVTGAGDIYKVRWSRLSGPDCIMNEPSKFVNRVYGLNAGTYVFNIMVEDVGVNISNAQVTITVTNTGASLLPPTEEYATNINY